MIEFRRDDGIKERQAIHARLGKYNREMCPWLKDHSPLQDPERKPEYADFLAFDDGRLIGGIVGFVAYNWYFLDLLYVEEAYREQDVGTRLIRLVEEFCRNERLTGIRLETWNFQARGFYEKNGSLFSGNWKTARPEHPSIFSKSNYFDKPSAKLRLRELCRGEK